MNDKHIKSSSDFAVRECEIITVEPFRGFVYHTWGIRILYWQGCAVLREHFTMEHSDYIRACVRIVTKHE